MVEVPDPPPPPPVPPVTVSVPVDNWLLMALTSAAMAVSIPVCVVRIVSTFPMEETVPEMTTAPVESTLTGCFSPLLSLPMIRSLIKVLFYRVMAVKLPRWPCFISILSHSVLRHSRTLASWIAALSNCPSSRWASAQMPNLTASATT